MNKKDKILMAIWMYNQLIDRYPEIYKVLKKNYVELKQNK
jgi:hypothetical protein